MKFLKAFIAGITLPSVILPFGLYALNALGKGQILQMTSIHFLPLIWGLWNALYFVFLRYFLYVFGLHGRLYITGALLGLLIAIGGVYWLHLPEDLGVHDYLKYLPLLIAPIIYAFLWRYIVYPLNQVVGLHD